MKMNPDSKNYDVTIYTDGSASPNPGKGGYGTVVIQDGNRSELSQGYRKTTNNRMEILGAISGLEAIEGKNLNIRIVTDSQYVAKMFNEGHAGRWKNNRWMRTKKDRAMNPDLWNRLIEVAGKHTIQFEWVKGHAGHTENERCDVLATQAGMKDFLLPDEGYEDPDKHYPKAEGSQAVFDLFGMQ